MERHPESSEREILPLRRLGVLHTKPLGTVAGQGDCDFRLV
jgi:hypothetical protein